MASHNSGIDIDFNKDLKYTKITNQIEKDQARLSKKLDKNTLCIWNKEVSKFKISAENYENLVSELEKFTKEKISIKSLFAKRKQDDEESDYSSDTIDISYVERTPDVLESKIETLNVIIMNKNMELESAEGQVSKGEDKVTELEHKIKDLETTIKEKNKKLNIEQKKELKLEEELKASKLKLAELETEIYTLQLASSIEVEDLIKIEDNRNKEFDASNNNKRDKSLYIQEIEDKLNLFTKKLKESELNNEILLKENEQLSEKLESKDKNIEIKKLSKMNASLERECDDLRSKLEETNDASNYSENMMKELNKKIKIIANLTDANELLEKKQKELLSTRSLDEKNIEIEKLSKMIASLERECDDLRSKLEETNDALNDSDNAIKELNDRNSHPMQGDSTKPIDNVVELQNIEIKNLNHKVNELKTENDNDIKTNKPTQPEVLEERQRLLENPIDEFSKKDDVVEEQIDKNKLLKQNYEEFEFTDKDKLAIELLDKNKLKAEQLKSRLLERNEMLESFISEVNGDFDDRYYIELISYKNGYYEINKEIYE